MIILHGSAPLASFEVVFIFCRAQVCVDCLLRNVNVVYSLSPEMTVIELQGHYMKCRMREVSQNDGHAAMWPLRRHLLLLVLLPIELVVGEVYALMKSGHRRGCFSFAAPSLGRT